MSDNNGNKDLIPTTPAELPEITSPGDIYFNLQLFEHVQRVAKMFASSNLVPERYRNQIGDCVIALSMAHRLKADPIMVMQNTYVVHGSPGMEGKMVIALINSSGIFSQLLFREVKNESGQVVSCSAYANLRETGEEVSSELTWDEVVGHGWDQSKKSMKSKWLTMRGQMFRYRTAAFFARTFCPEVLFGMQTTEELHDVIDITPGKAGDNLNDLIGKSIDTHRMTATEVVSNREEGFSSIGKGGKGTVAEPVQEEAEVVGKSNTEDQSATATSSQDLQTKDDSEQCPGELTEGGKALAALQAEVLNHPKRTLMTSDHPDHPFNKTKWINIRSAGSLQIHVKNHKDDWDTTTEEGKQEFYDKWKRILKAGAVGAWPFEDMEKPATVEDEKPLPQEVAASLYLGQFKILTSKESLREYFTDNNTSILNHTEKDLIIAEYDRLMDGFESGTDEQADPVTARDFLRIIYHAETTGSLSGLGMKYGEIIDALPEHEEIWSRLDARTSELNGGN